MICSTFSMRFHFSINLQKNIPVCQRKKYIKAMKVILISPAIHKKYYLDIYDCRRTLFVKKADKMFSRIFLCRLL